MYKALAHPRCAAPLAALRSSLAALRRLVIFDPHDQYLTVDAFLDLDGLAPDALWTGDLGLVGARRGRLRAEPPGQLFDGTTVLALDFDADAAGRRLQPLLDAATGGQSVLMTLESLKLDDAWIGHAGHYLNPLNFVTNWAFFRDEGDCHTRVITANYWRQRGAGEVRVRGLLFDGQGRELATLERLLTRPGEALILDSASLRAEHALAPFCGQLFLHVVGAAGNDVLKFALDLYGNDSTGLSATHDANVWPAESYAGIPAPREDQQVRVWLQNPHCRPIPSGAMAWLTPDGREQAIEQAVPPFATVATPVPSGASQHTLRSNQRLVRPRYEVLTADRRCMAHANIFRQDLEADGHYWQHAASLGRGYLLVAPLLDSAEFETRLMLTPMSPSDPALRLRTYDPGGRLLKELPLPICGPEGAQWIEAGEGEGNGGHLELSYDPRRTSAVDGWFHAIFRYRLRGSGHLADTSFGSHMFNLPVAWRGEPQSYSGPPPGLTTRLFLRNGYPRSSFIVLVYPASGPWHEHSATTITAHASDGGTLDSRRLSIPIQGSRQIEVEQLFGRRTAEKTACLVIDDRTCRLFGYHGLREGDGFSMDHLFGF